MVVVLRWEGATTAINLPPITTCFSHLKNYPFMDVGPYHPLHKGVPLANNTSIDPKNM
jgi:hypothetical protein